MAQSVTIGRIVRFVDTDGSEWPAIVTVVHSETLVSLQVFRPSDVTPRTSVPFRGHAAEPTVGFTWHWPDRN